MSDVLLLDTNTVSYFLQAGREKELAHAASCVAMSIVGEVKDELKRDRQRGGKFFEQWLAASTIVVRPIPVGSEASATLARLVHPKDPSKDLGERASIALAASDPSMILVTHDRNGVWIALREIPSGARMMGLAPFLRIFFDRGVLTDPAVADEVIKLAGPVEQRPTWWASWRAGLAVPAAAAPAALSS